MEAKDQPKAEVATAEKKQAPKAGPPRPRPEKITWVEQGQWRDGTPAGLQGANSAYYLSRKIMSTRPRTAMVQISGPSGFRMWINGELAQTSPPSPPVAPPGGGSANEGGAGGGPAAKDEGKPDGDAAEPPAPEIDDATLDEMMGHGRNGPEKTFRIGLRPGENEIVVKVVFGDGAGRRGPGGVPAGGAGGGSFTFRITPEGDDIVSHEVVTALRLEAVEPAAGAAATAKSAASEASSSNAASPVDAGHGVVSSPVGPAAGTGAPKKVGLVGEKSAPPRPSEDGPGLSPSERRKKVLREHYRSHIDPVGRLVAAELARLKAEESLIKQRLPQTLVMEELEKPRQAYVFKRGLYKNRGENVEPATPSALSPMPKDASRAIGSAWRDGWCPASIP